MQINDLNKYIQDRVKSLKPFVFYRLSKESDTYLLESNTIDFVSDFQYKESGFIFHPFDSKKNKIEFIKGTPSKTAIVKGASTLITLKDLSREEKPFCSTFELYQNQFNIFQEEFINRSMKKAILSRIKFMEIDKLDVANMFLKMLSAYPEAYAYLYYSPSAGLWIGASPEKFVFVHHNILETTALAGTISEGENWSDKEKEEQMIVTHFITQNLHELNHLEADAPETIKAGNLYHIRANIRGELNAQSNLSSIINKLHPTPAVGGFPKEKALEMIAAVEKHKREFYSGFAGPVNINSSTHLFVNLRCAKIYPAGLSLFVGGGITKSSEVKKEWEETEKKANTIANMILNH